jgi:hypothetical protein
MVRLLFPKDMIVIILSERGRTALLSGEYRVRAVGRHSSIFRRIHDKEIIFVSTNFCVPGCHSVHDNPEKNIVRHGSADNGFHDQSRRLRS